jgi:hypothetical protein
MKKRELEALIAALDIQLPTCPICKARPISWRHAPKPSNIQGPVQEIRFECEASYYRDGKSDYNDGYMPFGPWSSWKCTVQCSNATKIALELLSQKTDD